MGSSSSTRRKKHKKKRSYKNIIILIIVALILGGVYYYTNIYMHDPEAVVSQQPSLPKYTLLENKDSTCIAAVIYNTNMNINDISKTFYKSHVFWPYIFIANQKEPAIIRNPLDIPKGVIIKIPKISDELLNLNNAKSLQRVQSIADSILEATNPIEVIDLKKYT